MRAGIGQDSVTVRPTLRNGRPRRVITTRDRTGKTSIRNIVPVMVPYRRFTVSKNDPNRTER